MIATTRTGHGPPLVLVHGTTADHTRWAPLLPVLDELFTVHAVDRRGRGASGDDPDHAIEREFEDVAAVVDAIAEPVHLLGHSYGAICALEAAHAAIATSVVVVLPGQQHTAMNTAPELFLREVLAFLAIA